MLALQAVSWLSFLGYTPAFFRLRSPRLALATRVVHAASTVASTNPTEQRRRWNLVFKVHSPLRMNAAPPGDQRFAPS